MMTGNTISSALASGAMLWLALGIFSPTLGEPAGPSRLPAAFVCEFGAGVFSALEDGRFGAGDVRLVAGIGAAHFVETTAAGNLTVTTVFLGGTLAGDRFFAAHSRHVGSVDEPWISQYLGSCEAKWP
jgi:hypothetical protein